MGLIKTTVIGLFLSLMGASILAQTPTIISIEPPINSNSVELTQNIVVTFDAPLNEATINDTTLMVVSGIRGILDGVISYNSIDNSITFNPNSDLYYNETINFYLSSQIESDIGESIDNFKGRFITRSETVDTFSYFNRSQYETNNKPKGAAAADIDLDGYIDIVIVHESSESLSVHFNDGHGGFPVSTEYNIGRTSFDVCVSDFDNDGDIDIATTNENTGYLTVMYNDGTGYFSTPYAVLETLDGPHGMLAEDLNGDGYADLACANYDHGSFSIWLNLGNGDFGERNDYISGSRTITIKAGDLDNDGDYDLAMGLRTDDLILVYENNGSGLFEISDSIPVSSFPYNITLADLNDDGYLDIAAAMRVTHQVMVLLNDGFGKFLEPYYLSSGSAPYYVSDVDFDGDGDIDLVSANLKSNDIYCYLNDGAGSFSTYEIYETGGWPLYILDFDANKNGNPELAVLNAYSDDFYLYAFYDSTDNDADGDLNEADNCPNAFNPDQSDVTDNGLGDVCDPEYIFHAGFEGEEAP